MYRVMSTASLPTMTMEKVANYKHEEQSSVEAKKMEFE